MMRSWNASASTRGIGGWLLPISAMLPGPESLGNEHSVPSLAYMRGTKRSVPMPCQVAEKELNRPIGGSRWNRLVENLEKFIDNLNGCLSDYARSSRN
jgi:hypothetical protein